jgi:YppF-like protein
MIKERIMMLEDLIQRFNTVNKRNPSHVNELLDYIQKCYIHGELTISEYKGFFNELDKKNAEKPEAYFIKNKPFDNMNIPS